MKKVLAIVLAVAMICSLSIAFAGDPTTVTSVTESNTASADVTAQVTITAAETVYSVDVEFDEFEFTYAINNGTWDPETHSTVSGTEGWVTENLANKKDIKVTNHSNARITVTPSFAATEQGVTMSFSVNSAILSGADEGLQDIPSTTITGTIGGTPTNKTATNGTARKVGTVTITITATAQS